ncbi:TadE family type IV pilus minor pilin [Dietzia sp. CH92]|uniref:TadE family type IV pilus minor pilin n=1 Tax=Dietzia sp. CH92 TaxID=3051823 RepID=UPI0028D3095F|nr:TadE family type IV pilus minor pilin [Dietzia sp. CH92]
MSRRVRAAVARDDGSVTVEAALGIASLVVVVAVAAAGAAAALTQIGVVDAAREAARVAAMSGPGEGISAGQQVASGAQVTVTGAGSYVTAVVVAPARGLPGVELTGRAVARTEPGATG